MLRLGDWGMFFYTPLAGVLCPPEQKGNFHLILMQKFKKKVSTTPSPVYLTMMKLTSFDSFLYLLWQYYCCYCKIVAGTRMISCGWAVFPHVYFRSDWLICMHPPLDPTIVDIRMTLDVDLLILIKYKNCIIRRGNWESVYCISSALRVLCSWFRIHRWYVDLLILLTILPNCCGFYSIVCK